MASSSPPTPSVLPSLLAGTGAASAAASAAASGAGAAAGGMDERFVGFTLAVVSSVLIGASFCVKKHGLNKSEGHGTGDSYKFLLEPVWWGGTFLMAVGEFLNFAAYSFAPAILVTPMGALSVVISAVLASIFLGERLDRSGKIGCGLCAIGTTVIVLHAPPERDLHSVNELIDYITKPAFLTFALAAIGYIVVAIWRLAPRYGRKNMLVYISICSFGGSLLVIACKGVGIAVKLTIEGRSQFGSPYTYCFVLAMIFGLVFQLNYLNKALDLFPAAAVSPVYYVFFTTTTITANLICFQGAEVQSARDIVNVVCGFLVMCIGVFLVWGPSQKDFAFAASAFWPFSSGSGGESRSSIQMESIRAAKDEEEAGLLADLELGNQ